MSNVRSWGPEPIDTAAAAPAQPQFKTGGKNLMKLKFPGKCQDCGDTIPEGTQAEVNFDTKPKLISCLECLGLPEYKPWEEYNRRKAEAEEAF